VVEPRSNTMKLGVHRDELAPSLTGADQSWFLSAPELGWDLAAALKPLGERLHFGASVEELVDAWSKELRTGDQVLIMSNGGFGGLHERLLTSLRARQ
jgi:UDP-N-acetylmuramate: L-alanyl-gamma-D-glutamyl-meso-diaminopimelate ligase